LLGPEPSCASRRAAATLRPSQGEKREHIDAVVGSGALVLDDANEVKEVRVTYAQLTERITSTVRRWVDHVEGYAFEDGTEIKTADELVECGEQAILEEVYAFIEGLLALDTGQRKNSSGSSASPQAATQASAGTAASAGGSVSTSSETATGPTTTPGSVTSPPPASA
jgi:hypothetical protein